jgi:hypothetical protein
LAEDAGVDYSWREALLSRCQLRGRRRQLPNLIVRHTQRLSGNARSRNDRRVARCEPGGGCPTLEAGGRAFGTNFEGWRSHQEAASDAASRSVAGFWSGDSVADPVDLDPPRLELESPPGWGVGTPAAAQERSESLPGQPSAWPNTDARSRPLEAGPGLSA